MTFRLSVSRLAKRYGEVVALSPIDLSVAEGEFLTLLGPSGSGKTTLLSLIAGLTLPDEGSIVMGGADVTWRPPYERDLGMVFQNYALFPHMTVAENVAFPLKMRKVGGGEARQRVAEALEMVRLPHVASRFPRELSGGQQQRIALARCLVYRPSIVLMDEPLGALDKKLRDQMQLEIKRIHREMGVTVIYVTHDQEEAMTMSDRICLMEAGAIAQLGAPGELYFRPRSLFVADFLGESNLLPAVVRSADEGALQVLLEGETAPRQVIGNGRSFSAGERVTVMVRPQNLAVGRDADASLRGMVEDVMVTGSLTKLHVKPANERLPPLLAAHPTRSGGVLPRIGDPIALSFEAADAVAIPLDE